MQLKDHWTQLLLKCHIHSKLPEDGRNNYHFYFPIHHPSAIHVIGDH